MLGRNPPFQSAVRSVITLLLILASLGWGAPSGEELLRALKDGDVAVIKRQIAQGAPVNAVDEFGSSALMYAALYSDVAVLRVLLDHGADPNHADNAGATALIWAIPNEPKVRLLLERGARVNTASKLTGRTPLLIAAGRPGAAAVVQLLLEKGADPKARDIRGESTIFRAAFSGDMEVLRLLVDRGADVNARTNENFTALMEAAVHGNGSMIEMLLSRAADTKAHDEEGNTALTSANDYHDFTLFRLLISKGADPGYRNMAGQDLLMAAASSDSSSPEVIREMINLPLDPTIRSANFHISHGLAKDSEGPLDWARRHGDTPVTRVLAELSGDQPRRDAADESARLNATTPRAAIEKAVPLLYAGGAEFFKRSGCTSCHHNVLPALVFSHARIKGIVVDEEKVRRNYLQSVAWIKGRQEMLYQDVRFPGGDTTASYLLWGLDADGHKRDRATDAVIHHLGAAQAIDGGWRVRADRPPIESGRVTPTALSIHALRLYAIPGRKVEFDARIRRAARWLSTYRARTGEEKAMRLLGLTWAEASSGSIRDAAAQLSAAQRPDGGWAQLETLPSDAYATGQALYALHTAGQLRDQALQKGVRFLLQNQLADGSWHVRSRSYPIQSLYFDTGFPHGRDQWISAAGTSWACIALSLTIEP